jgi:hypothetical protein
MDVLKVFDTWVEVLGRTLHFDVMTGDQAAAPRLANEHVAALGYAAVTVTRMNVGFATRNPWLSSRNRSAGLSKARRIHRVLVFVEGEKEGKAVTLHREKSVLRTGAGCSSFQPCVRVDAVRPHQWGTREKEMGKWQV